MLISWNNISDEKHLQISCKYVEVYQIKKKKNGLTCSVELKSNFSNAYKLYKNIFEKIYKSKQLVKVSNFYNSLFLNNKKN